MEGAARVTPRDALICAAMAARSFFGAAVPGAAGLNAGGLGASPGATGGTAPGRGGGATALPGRGGMTTGAFGRGSVEIGAVPGAGGTTTFGATTDAVSAAGIVSSMAGTAASVASCAS
jgi:hypothetical protein